MKRSVKTIVTITLALIVISSIAYAAEKKQQVREIPPTEQAVSEEEAVKAELLIAVGQPEPSPEVKDANKGTDPGKGGSREAS